MAGKTKQQQSNGAVRPNSPYAQQQQQTGAGGKRPGSGKATKCSQQQGTMAGQMKGHMGLKSSPFSPTSAKLTSQYMVLDHMAAHYKKIANAKSAIDMKQPKAWSVSQKMRDQAKREALKHDTKRRAGHSDGLRHSARDSDVDRFELYDMMESLNEDDVRNDAVNTTLEVHLSDHMTTTRQDQRLVDQLVQDNRHSPSHYHSPRPARSNIPGQTLSRPLSSTYSRHGRSGAGYLNVTNGEMRGMSPSTTPRQDSADLLHKQAHKFTDEKAFTPRTLKTKKEVQSRLSSLKCYRPPPKKQTKSGPVKSEGQPVMTRPETPMTADSVDLMNETLMSRDLSKGSARTPTGIPPLDISMDADHIRWLKEQSKKAQIRSVREPSEPGSMSHIDGEHLYKTQRVGAKTQTRNRSTTEEEELKYLEFVQEVTNDILETGVFTNRVLKKVFEKHIEKRKHELKVSRMRELMDELRTDLGIPADNHRDDDMAGYGTIGGYNDDLGTTLGDTQHSFNTYNGDYQDTLQSSLGAPEPRDKRHRSPQRSAGLNPMMTTQRFELSRVKPMAAEDSSLGKPPLPRPRSRGMGRKVSLEGNDIDETPERTLGYSEEFDEINESAASPPKSQHSLGYSDEFEEDNDIVSSPTKSNKSLGYSDDFEEDHNDTQPKPTPRKLAKHSLSPRPISDIDDEKEPSSIQVSELEDFNELDDF